MRCIIARFSSPPPPPRWHIGAGGWPSILRFSSFCADPFSLYPFYTFWGAAFATHTAGRRRRCRRRSLLPHACLHPASLSPTLCVFFSLSLALSHHSRTNSASPRKKRLSGLSTSAITCTARAFCSLPSTFVFYQHRALSAFLPVGAGSAAHGSPLPPQAHTHFSAHLSMSLPPLIAACLHIHAFVRVRLCVCIFVCARARHCYNSQNVPGNHLTTSSIHSH